MTVYIYFFGPQMLIQVESSNSVVFFLWCIFSETLIAFPAVFIARTTNLCDFPSNYPTMALPSNYQTSCFLSGRQHAVALAVDVQDNMLFFSDISAKKVSAVRLAVDSNVFDIAGVTQSVEGN